MDANSKQAAVKTLFDRDHAPIWSILGGVSVAGYLAFAPAIREQRPPTEGEVFAFITALGLGGVGAEGDRRKIKEKAKGAAVAPLAQSTAVADPAEDSNPDTPTGLAAIEFPEDAATDEDESGLAIADGPVEAPTKEFFEWVDTLGTPKNPTLSLLKSTQPANPIDPDFEIDTIDNEEQDLDIDLASLQGKYRLIVTHDSMLKTSPRQSNELTARDFDRVNEGNEIYIDAWNWPDEKNGHIKVHIDEYEHHNGGDFFVFAKHFQLYSTAGNRVEIERQTSPVTRIKKGLSPLVLPTGTVYLEDAIEGTHFTWAEATKNGQRVPDSPAIVANLKKQAVVMNKFRAYLGNLPLIVTSWYRDPVTNRRVGGASRSSHLWGYAADVLCPSMSIWALQEKAAAYWRRHAFGGFGEGADRGFIHISTDGRLRFWDY